MITQRQLFLAHVAQTSPSPLLLEAEHARGCMLYTNDGKQYLDLISGISVSNLGHGHPKVIAAVKDQVDKYMHLMVYGELVQTPQVKLSQLLTSLLPPALSSVYFTNSGSEAVEGAMKLAKRYTGRSEIIAFEKAYHGSTQGSLSLMGDEFFKQSFRPLLPGIKHLPFNDLLYLEEITTKTACVIIEPIQGEAGCRPFSQEFMDALSLRCKETSTLLIFDEIQCGFGRTGNIFAFEGYNITPDVLLVAKSFGGGMPLGAFISSAQIMNSLTSEPVLGHITTFGGHPVCCAAGLAALNVLLEEQLHLHVEAKAGILREHLKHPLIKTIHGKGLLMALEFETAEICKKVIDTCLENGLFTDWFLFAPQCLRLAPPLVISEAELRSACTLLLKSMDQVNE